MGILGARGGGADRGGWWEDVVDEPGFGLHFEPGGWCNFLGPDFCWAFFKLGKL